MGFQCIGICFKESVLTSTGSLNSILSSPFFEKWLTINFFILSTVWLILAHISEHNINKLSRKYVTYLFTVCRELIEKHGFSMIKRCGWKCRQQLKSFPFHEHLLKIFLHKPYVPYLTWEWNFRTHYYLCKTYLLTIDYISMSDNLSYSGWCKYHKGKRSSNFLSSGTLFLVLLLIWTFQFQRTDQRYNT